jgi:ribosomal protein L13
MITSKKRLGRIPREASREVVMRTWSLSVRQGREKERVLERRVEMMLDHHNQGRRRT